MFNPEKKMSETPIPIAVAEGDGIGPEIMAAVLLILKEGGANIETHNVEVGEKIYLQGFTNGIKPETWDILRNTKAFLKAPITTPQGGGFKSINVNIRTTMGLYANVRPCVSYHPFIKTKHPKMDVVIVRENEEDLYAGIEYRQTPDSTVALKVITRPGCERIARYAFQYAEANKRKKVTCFTKDNILKISDGLFHNVFEEIGKEYPNIEKEHWIVDIGAAKLADTPENFDVIVLPNLYGDILSDVSAQIAGSVGLAGSANIGQHGAMFEAIHGSAPRRAGQNLANPSGLLHGAILMLVHIGQPEAAMRIHNAWLATIEDGIHTYDIFKEGVSKEKVGTREFAQAVVERLGRKPKTLKEAVYGKADQHRHTISETKSVKKDLIGVDVYIQANTGVEELQTKLSRCSGETLCLDLITNRGAKVWPDTIPETSLVDQWRCRFVAKSKGTPVSMEQILELLGSMNQAELGIIQTQNLYSFDGEPTYSLAQL